MKTTSISLGFLLKFLIPAVILIGTSIFFIRKCSSNVRVVREDFNLGNLVLGKKITIRDHVTLKKPYDYEIPLPGPLNNMRKKGTLTIVTEIGYFREDIIRSERIDSLRGREVLGKSLVVYLPLPDTLNSYYDNDEEDNEKPYEGWEEYLLGKSEYMMNEQEKVLDSLKSVMYSAILGLKVNTKTSTLPAKSRYDRRLDIQGKIRTFRGTGSPHALWEPSV